EVVPSQHDGEIADALAARYADYHGATFDGGAEEAGIRLARRYLQTEAFPGSLASLLDDVGARARLAGMPDTGAIRDRPRVGEGEITATVSQLTGVPVAKLTESELDRIQNMEEHLHERIVGQDEAVTAVSKAIRRSKAGIADSKRPVGSFVFAGPTGVGKT